MNSIKNFKNQLNLTNQTANASNNATSALQQAITNLGNSLSPVVGEFANLTRLVNGAAVGGSLLKDLMSDAEILKKDQADLTAIVEGNKQAYSALVQEYNRASQAAYEYDQVLGDVAGLARILEEEEGFTSDKAYKEAAFQMSERLNKARDAWKKYGSNIDEVKASIEKLTEEQRAAKGQLEDTTKALDDTNMALDAETTRMAKNAAAAAEWAAAIAIVVLAYKTLKKQFETALEVSKIGDEFDKTSQKIGMSATAYQKWGYVAQICGTNATTLKTAMRGLNKAMNSNSAAFQELGISQKEVASMNSDQLFERTVSALQNLSSATDKARIASEIFGQRAYAEMMPLLNQTNAQVKALERTYDLLGATMNDETVSASANLRDSITTLKAAFQGLKNTLSERIIPLIAKVVEWITIAVAYINIFLRAVLGLSGSFGKLNKNKSFGTGIKDSLDAATGSAKALKRELMGFDEINKLSDDNEGGGGAGGVGIDMADFDTSGIEKIGVLSEKAQEKIKKFREAIEKIAPVLQVLVPLAEIVGGALLIAFGGPAAKVAGLMLILTGLTTWISNGFLGKIWEAIKGFFANIGEALGSAVEWVKEKLSGVWQWIVNTPLVQFWIGIFEGIKESLSGACEKIKEIIVSVFNKVKEIVSTITQIFVALGKAFYTYVIKPIINYVSPIYTQYVKPVIDKIKGGLQTFWDWISKIFRTIGGTIGDAIGGSIKGVINGIISIVQANINSFIRLINNALTVINAIPGVNISRITELNLPRLATGGITNGATTAIIGEAGREAVLPLENNTEWMDMLAERLANKMNNNQNISLDVDGKNLFNIMVDRNNSMVNRTGRSPLKV